MAKKEQWQIDYEVRVRAISWEIQTNGHEFFLETFQGRKKVTGIDAIGAWATSGEGLSRQSWMICSTHIYPWAEEIGIPQDRHFSFVIFSRHASEASAELRAIRELDVRKIRDYRIAEDPNGLWILWAAK